jgi:RHS repeat-associated protein
MAHGGLRHSLLGDLRSRLGLAIGFVLAVLVLVPAGASAEPLCTDTWTGPNEGSWQTASNWSAGKAPGSIDVACIEVGKTVDVAEGAGLAQAGVLEDRGTVVIAGGKLELVNALEASSAYALRMTRGALVGVGSIDVSSSLVIEGGEMTGSGSTVLESGGSGTVSIPGGTTSLVERSFVNEGTTTFSQGQIWMSEGAKLKNTGTFRANSETGEPQFFIPPGSSFAPVITNTATFQKSAGSGATEVEVYFENRGTAKATSGSLVFTDGGLSSGTNSWVGSEGGSIVFVGGSFSLSNGSWSGAIDTRSGFVSHFKGPSITVEGTSGNTAQLSISAGELVVGSGSMTVENLTLTGGTVNGAGTLAVAGSLMWTNENTMKGSGATVVEPGATATVNMPAENTVLIERTFVNEGTTTFSNGQFWMSEGATILNKGTFKANSETGEPQFFINKTGPVEPQFINEGSFEKTAGTGATIVGMKFANLGVIRELTGELRFERPVLLEQSTQYGQEDNPSNSAQSRPECGEGVDCATGNFSQAQTDLAVGGRGVGLDLMRTYNSQAAVAATEHGMFGYGWTSSFSDHLVVEKASKEAILFQADGSTVSFTEGSGGSFTAPTWSQDTLSGSTEAGYTLTLADQTKDKFAGSNGRLESVTDRNGNATTLSYTEAGRLEAITDPASRKITFTYNAEGFVESAKDPMGHVVKYAYEGGELASVTEPGEEKARWQFKYGSSHQLTTMTDGRGGALVMEYNGSHQVISQKDPMSRTQTFEYAPFLTKITNKATSAVTDERFDSNDLPFSTTRGVGTAYETTEKFSYSVADCLLSVTDGNGHTTKYAYDSANDRRSMVDADEHETKWTYDSTHDIETETLPNGETTTIKRDSHGNPEVIERPAPGGKTQVTKYKYGSHGEVESMTDPLERTWKYEYDAAGDKIAETNPEGDKRTWGYNEDSQETSMVSPRGHASGAKESEFTTATERDAQGRPIKVTDPLGHETKYTYDGDGNLETVTDPEGHKTTYTYDADNERTKVEEPNKTITETEYDGAGQVKKQIDGNKHATEYARNVLEQVIEVIDPLSRKTSKEYDKAGNLVSVTDAAKRTTTYKYDPDNRLTEITYSDGKTPTVKYEYNGDGDRTKMEDGTGTTTYEYDQLDRLTATKDGHGNTAGYEYDLANEQTKITYPNGKVVEREYDKAGRLKSTTDWSKNTIKFTYDADSDLTATTFPSATSDEDTYKYDDTDAMTEVKMKKSTETLASLAYTRNKDELVEKATSKGLPGEEKPAYTYDKNNRLTKGVGIPYEYDAANNPTTIGTEHTYSYNAADELEKSVLKKATAATYTYNEVGERTKTEPASGPATTYGYDQAGNLTSVTRPKGTEAAIEDTYAYNGDGLRTSQAISGTTTYLAWDLTEKLPLILNDGTNSYIYGPGGLPVEQINTSTGTVSYLHHDQAGSTRLITGSTGTVTGKCTYGAYGTPTCEGTTTTPLGYDGQYTNSDTGLIYLRAREYDPTTAQFLSVDPDLETTEAAYGYAADNPLSLGDPTGLIPWSPKIKEAQAKCGSWKAWHSTKSPFYGNKNIYSACQGLLSLPSQVYGTEGSGFLKHLLAAGQDALALGISAAKDAFVEGCTIGAESAIELGPAGATGVCLVSGSAAVVLVTPGAAAGGAAWGGYSGERISLRESVFGP